METVFLVFPLRARSTPPSPCTYTTLTYPRCRSPSYSAPTLALPGLLLPSTAMRLQHAADAVFSLQTLSDDSEVFALLPDAARLVVSVSALIPGAEIVVGSLII